MYINKIAINNFRLLKSVVLSLEKQTTVIVGRNNSGKTSLTELFRCLLEDSAPRFKLEDFSLSVHEQFWTAFELAKNGSEENEIRKVLPTIKIEFAIEYGDSGAELGPLGEFVIDLEPDCTVANINILYALQDGKIQAFFENLEEDKPKFFKAIKERIPKLFKTSLEAVDPNDPTNRKILEFSKLQELLQGGFISAHRTLDNTTRAEKAILGKILETLFKAADSETANNHYLAEELKKAVAGIEEGIDTNFNAQLFRLIPTFNLFGYPGLADPKLHTETTFNVEQLLSNHTTVGYEGIHGVNLPESYNGLGPRNLIFILLKLFEFFRSFTAKQPVAGVHLVFIEEPEAHLHPQMQNVFIRKLNEIIKEFSDQYNQGNPWPVQFIVTTHSSHIANEAPFDSMRYFLAQPCAESPQMFMTEIKDIQSGLSSEPEANREFLHKYMTLTRCDLLFADKGVLIEGPTERLLLPKMIEKVDKGHPNGAKLSSQYLSVIEVGGAYAHIFFNLLDFLKLKTLIITDIDTVDQQNEGKKCRVSLGTHSSNSCINNWFQVGNEKPSKDELLKKNESEKIIKCRRLAFQIPHSNGDACGRSFEEAFMLANQGIFNITGTTPEEQEGQALKAAEKVSKTDFALKYALEKDGWVVPRYIEEGLKWLAQPPVSVPDADLTQEEGVDASVQTEKEEHGDA